MIEPPQQPRPATFFSVYPSVMFPMFIALVDQTIVAAALPVIAADFGDVGALSWVVLGYLVTAAIAAPTYGKLGDLLGKRRMLCIALGMVTVGCLACLMAQSLWQLVAGRMLQGTGGGGLMVLSHAVIADVVAPRERAKYQGIFASLGMVASTTGPLLGGVLAFNFGWRSIFVLLLPFLLLALLLILRLPAGRKTGSKPRFDLPGLAFFAMAVFSILVVLSDLQDFPPKAPMRIGILICVALVAVLLLMRQERRSPSPLIPPALLAKADVSRGCAMAACHGAALVGLLTFLPLYFRLVYGLGGFGIGVAILPVPVGIALGSTITGALISRTGRAAIWPMIGLTSASALILAFAFLGTSGLGLVPIGILLGLIALSLGSTMAVVLIVAQTAAGPAMVGSASGLVQLARAVGAAAGTALISAALFAVLGQDNPHSALGTGLAQLLDQGRDALESMTVEVQVALAQRIETGFRNAFAVLALFPAAGALLAWTLPTRRFD